MCTYVQNLLYTNMILAFVDTTGDAMDAYNVSYRTEECAKLREQIKGVKVCVCVCGLCVCVCVCVCMYVGEGVPI